MNYCPNRFRTRRRVSREVRVGSVGVGGAHPLRLQSMTTSDTQDVAATVRQAIALAEVGCEIVRVTAPNVAAARCLREIRAGFSAAGFAHVPLVADIHFLPAAALEAVEHVEKVRVNPGNYADKKRFAVREYSDADYAAELERLHDAFSPLVRRCRELGRALRIGTNHGSLSDRILNRYGDTPLGMVESALEFLRIAEAHGHRDLILSMKASNPKVMIQAYRLLVARMAEEDMHYPLHLGVTEAGDGEDGRIKSAIGIGSLLLDGLGDTIRVSLTEDSVYEIPVARAIADKAMRLWAEPAGAAELLAALHEGGERVVQALELGVVVGVRILADGEFLLVGVIAGVDADLLDVFDRLHGGGGEEVDVGDERDMAEAGGGELGADVLEALRGGDVRGGHTDDFAADLGEGDGLADGGGDVLGVAGRHRLEADGVRAPDADGTDHDFEGAAADGLEARRAIGHGCGEMTGQAARMANPDRTGPGGGDGAHGEASDRFHGPGRRSGAKKSRGRSRGRGSGRGRYFAGAGAGGGVAGAAVSAARGSRLSRIMRGTSEKIVT